MEALNIKSVNEADAYRPVAPELLYLNEKEFRELLRRRRAITLTNMSLPSADDNVSAGVIPGRDFSSAKNVNAAQVYADLKDYLAENSKLKRIICCYSEGSRERLTSLMNEYGIDELALADDWHEALSKAGHKKTALIIMNLAHGFKGAGWCLISEQDILGERQNRRTAKR